MVVPCITLLYWGREEVGMVVGGGCGGRWWRLDFSLGEQLPTSFHCDWRAEMRTDDLKIQNS